MDNKLMLTSLRWWCWKYVDGIFISYELPVTGDFDIHQERAESVIGMLGINSIQANIQKQNR